MSIRLVPGLLAAAIVLGPSVAAAAPHPAPTCRACIVIDDSGTVLWGRRPDLSLANASTTKMLTALLAVRAGVAADRVTVSRNAAGTGQGGFDLRAGEAYSGEDLLHALLLTSSNDAAVALAEHVAGSEQAFVTRMNDVASTLGATGTRFATSHGLDTPGHYSTARDLALIGAAVLATPALADIVAAADARIRTPGGTAVIENTNLLLESYRGAIGVKTGSTALAGDVMVAAARRHHRQVIAVAMDSESAADDAAALLDFGFRELARTVLIPEGDVVGTLVFDPAGAVSAVAAEPLRGFVDPATMAVDFVPDPGVHAPLEAGQRIGTIVVTGAGGTELTLEAVASEPIAVQQESWLRDFFVGLLAATGALVTLISARL